MGHKLLLLQRRAMTADGLAQNAPHYRHMRAALMI